MSRFTLLLAAVALWGCPGPDPEPRLSSLQPEVFSASCTFSACHGAVGPQRGLNLTAGKSFASLVEVPSAADPSVLRVSKGNPDASLLLRVLEGPALGVRQMPLNGELTPGQINAVREWIRLGANDD